MMWLKQALSFSRKPGTSKTSLKPLVAEAFSIRRSAYAPQTKRPMVQANPAWTQEI